MGSGVDVTERPNETSLMSSPDPAPRALNAWPKSVQEKIETLTARQAALRAEVQRAQSDEALTRARLGAALMDALAARCEAEARARGGALAHWRAQAISGQRPARRNRYRRRAEKLVVRLGGGPLVVAASGLWLSGGRQVSAIAAYVGRGVDPTAQPHALFDQAFYLERYPDVAAAGLCPLVHYILQGGAELRDPHPLFNARFYVEHNRIDLGETGLTPLEHYMRIGAFAGLDPHPLFRTDHYLTQAVDLFGAREAPLAHFLRVGAASGLSPHPLFEPTYYASQLGGEVAANPLLHFLLEGSARGLKPNPLFDPAWFARTYPDFAGQEALTAFAWRGRDAGLSPGPWFDGAAHVAKGGPSGEGLDPLTDYLWGGAWRVGESAPGLHTSAYLVAHPELAATGQTPLGHWAARNPPGG